MRNLGLIITTAIFLGCVADCLGQTSNPSDWPQYQYNAQRTGYNDHTHLIPPLQLSWVLNVFDSANWLKGVTVVDGRIYATHDNKGWSTDGRAPYLRCLEASNGSVLWDYLFPGVDAVYPPAAAYGNLYFQVGNAYASEVVALTADRGFLVWASGYRQQSGPRLPPLLYNGRLVAHGGTYGGVFCADAFSGDSLWFRFLDEGRDHTPSAWRDRVYVFQNDHLMSLKLTDGNLDWFLTTLPDSVPPEWISSHTVSTSPIIDTLHRLIVTQGQHYLTASSLDSPTVVWQKTGGYMSTTTYQWFPQGQFAVKSPALVNENLMVVDSGMLKCLNVTTGDELWRWQGEYPIVFPVVATVDYVYVADSSFVSAIALSTHTRVWRSAPWKGGYLTIARNQLFSATQHYVLACFESTAPMAVEDETAEAPNSFTVQNYPNPFNSSTIISYSLPTAGRVQIDIFNALGQRVRRLFDNTQSPGDHSITWDGRDDANNDLATGTYLCRITTSSTTATRKIMLLR